ncbi:MAG: mannitol dehydrogenase family protein [Pseudorhodobacter sp.]
MAKLNSADLDTFGPKVTRPDYDRSKLRPGIVHFGVGNFHRVHQAIAIDDCLHIPGNEGWAICGVGLTDSASGQAKVEAYRKQDNFYSVTVLTSPEPTETRIVGAMVDYIHAPTEPQCVLERLSDPATRIVSLTITEGAYNIDEATGQFRLDDPDIRSDLSGGTPRTVFGYLTLALARRRDAGLPPFTIMSCDNLQRNGDITRTATVGFARAVDPDLAGWIDRNCAFPNSMVDRIAPQVPETERQRLAGLTGVDDLMPATCETYTSWVVEDRFCNGRPPLEQVGVVFSDEVPAYVAVKGRLSNAAHMLMCYPSLLMGSRHVDEGMRDHAVIRLLRDFWTLDAMPRVEPPTGYSVSTFTESVIERFANPAIKDQLLRVAGDGTSKIVVFLGKTIKQVLSDGADPSRIAFLMACFGRYLRGLDDKGVPFDPFEPHLTDKDWARLKAGDPLAVLEIDAFGSLGMRQDKRFVDIYLDLTKEIGSSGTANALKKVLT